VVGAARAEGPQLTTQSLSRDRAARDPGIARREITGHTAKPVGWRLHVSHSPQGTAPQYLSRLTRFARAMDALTAPGECNRGMDSFDTAFLVAAPIAGLVLVVVTAIATLVAH
jgi:hypothetical protein